MAFVGESERARGLVAARRRMNPPELMKALDRLRCHQDRIRDRLSSTRPICAPPPATRGSRPRSATEIDPSSTCTFSISQATARTIPRRRTRTSSRSASTRRPAPRELRHGPSAAAAESLLLDAGATCYGYCCDVTRTHVKGAGAAASSFAELIARTEAMQQRLCGEVEVGLPYERLHERAHEAGGRDLDRPRRSRR